MKKIAMTVAVMVLSVSSLQAQDTSGKERGGKHGKHHRGDPIVHLTKKLNLSADQATEVEAILEASRARHRAIQESVKDEHCAVRDTMLNELAVVLDDEQMAEFEGMHKQGKVSGRQHGMPRFAKCDS